MLDRYQCDSTGHGLIPTHLTGIYIVGPSSAGKTTLCKKIAARLSLPPTQHVSEVARTVMRSTSFTREHVGMLDMQKAILQAQAEAEGNARGLHAQQFLLCDRSAIDPIAYAYFSTEGQEGARTLMGGIELQRLLPVYRNALFVLLNPVAEWIEDDGVRSLDDPHKQPAVFRELLADLGLRYKELGDDLKGLDDRVDQVLEWVAEMA